jgi:hypothetical protein
MAGWLDAVNPDVVVLSTAGRDGTTVLLESMARQRRMRIAGGHDVDEVVRTAPRRPWNGPRRPMAEICRETNQWLERAGARQ